MTGRPITEDDLHAYVDEMLDPARTAEVAGYLDQHADVAARVRGYSRQRQDLRAALAPIAEEPVPIELNLERMIKARQRPARLLQFAAAAVVLLCLGGVGGWSLNRMVEPPTEGIAALAQEAADSYEVYAPDTLHPVEIKAAGQAELVEWIAQRLGRRLALPDLKGAGYRFMGGRLVATSHGPAILLMYDNDHGTRLVLLTRTMTIDPDRPMMEHASGAVAGFAWSGKGIGYSLVGPLAPDALHPIANEVRRQVNSI